MRKMGKKGIRNVKILTDKIDTLDHIAFRLMRHICTNTRCAECPAHRPYAELNDRCDVMKINELIMRIQDEIIGE